MHNDYQRHLPYLWAAPRFEISRFRKYAEGAAGDGHIQEYLGSFGLSPLDQVGGRTMADTTTLWIAELFEFYAHNGNLSFVQEMWPTAQKALAWQIRASAQIGLPWHLVSTCVPPLSRLAPFLLPPPPSLRPLTAQPYPTFWQTLQV